MTLLQDAMFSGGFFWSKSNEIIQPGGINKKPDYFTEFSKCYFLGSLNESNEINFNIEFDTWRTLEDKDKIRIIFADSQEEVFGNEKTDYWGENKEIIIDKKGINNI